MLSNFVYKVCGCSGSWQMASFVETTIQQLREKIGTGKESYAAGNGTRYGTYKKIKMRSWSLCCGWFLFSHIKRLASDECFG